MCYAYLVLISLVIRHTSACLGTQNEWWVIHSLGLYHPAPSTLLRVLPLSVSCHPTGTAEWLDYHQCVISVRDVLTSYTLWDGQLFPANKWSNQAEYTVIACALPTQAIAIYLINQSARFHGSSPWEITTPTAYAMSLIV